MSAPNAKIVVTKEMRNKMIVTLGTGHQIPLHWNDRFYEGLCPICQTDIWESTPERWHSALIEHWDTEQH